MAHPTILKGKTYEDVKADYQGFVDKFKPKLTTDDCYTPPAVYDAVVKWVHENLINLDGLKVVRPFYPGGDFEKDAETYDENTIVIDNPPFSILSKIKDFYINRGVKFFLFAPALTIFSRQDKNGITYILSNSVITYENGAQVNTSFVTNLMPEVQIMGAPDLGDAIRVVQDKAKAAPLPKYQYPPNVVHAASLLKEVRAGKAFKIKATQCHRVASLKHQRKYKKSIFGGGYLLGDEAVKAIKNAPILERVKQEAAPKHWQLSDEEKDIIKRLNEAD